MSKFKFNLGDEIKEKITGFTGIVVSRCEFLTGCNRYSIQTKRLHEGKPVDWQNFDEMQIDIVEKEKVKIETPPVSDTKSKGGPRPPITNNYKNDNHRR